MDPYLVLGLEPGASQAEVKRAYRRLAKSLHPDAAGEAALPRFLELQDAYELLTGTSVRSVRAPGTGPGFGPRSADRTSNGSGAQGFQEPWRADPARARTAREQARTRARQGWSGARSPWGADARAAGPSSRPSGGTASRGGSTGPATSGAASDGGGPDGGGGDRQAAAGPAAGRRRSGAAGSGRTTSSGAGPPPGGRRRPSRKATLGSTSYDEAREPADRTWAGASWYGPTTGEYWHINPREYADPRKHGPGYSSRGRPDGPASASAPLGPEPATRSTADPDRVARPPGVDRPTDPTDRAPAASGVGGSVASARVEPRTQPEARLGWLPAPATDPWRRIGLALLAWPPLGLATAAAIGQATGCSSYAVSCDSVDRLIPWFAQVLLVGLLLASPPLASVLGAGSVAALVALVPGVGILTAAGGAASPAGGPALAGWLAVAWLAGVAVGVRRVLRRGDAAVPPAEPRSPADPQSPAEPP